MIYKIEIKYKKDEDYIKIIKLPLDSKIKVLLNDDEFIITLENSIDTYLYCFKKDEVNGFLIEMIN